MQKMTSEKLADAFQSTAKVFRQQLSLFAYYFSSNLLMQNRVPRLSNFVCFLLITLCLVVPGHSIKPALQV